MNFTYDDILILFGFIFVIASVTLLSDKKDKEVIDSISDYLKKLSK